MPKPMPQVVAQSHGSAQLAKGIWDGAPKANAISFYIRSWSSSSWKCPTSHKISGRSPESSSYFMHVIYSASPNKYSRTFFSTLFPKKNSLLGNEHLFLVSKSTFIWLSFLFGARLLETFFLLNNQGNQCLRCRCGI